MSLESIRAELGHTGTSSLRDAANQPGWSCHHRAKLAFNAIRPADADIGPRTAGPAGTVTGSPVLDPDGRPRITRTLARPDRMKAVRPRASGGPCPGTGASAIAHHPTPGSDPVASEARIPVGGTPDRRRT